MTDLELLSIRDFGFTLGGPLVKDKLWFFGGLDIGVTTYRLNRALNRRKVDATGADVKDSEGFNQVERIEGTLQSFQAEERTFQ